MPSRRSVLTGITLFPALAVLPLMARAMPSDIYAVEGVAIGGADSVAYFRDGVLLQGLRDHALMWRGAVWHFASMQNRDAFEMDPGAFAPRFGGYCAFAMSQGELAPSDPAAFTVHEGRLYLTYSMEARDRWRAAMAARIAAAEANWPAMFGS